MNVLNSEETEKTYIIARATKQIVRANVGILHQRLKVDLSPLVVTVDGARPTTALRRRFILVAVGARGAFRRRLSVGVRVRIVGRFPLRRLQLLYLIFFANVLI